MKYIRNEEGIKRLGARIKKLRTQQKISQSQLAFEAGIPREQVGRIEKGSVNTGISTILAIAMALHVHPKELFEF